LISANCRRHAPWRVDGSPQSRLSPGQAAFPVCHRPSAAGHCSAHARRTATAVPILAPRAKARAAFVPVSILQPPGGDSRQDQARTTSEDGAARSGWSRNWVLRGEHTAGSEAGEAASHSPSISTGTMDGAITWGMPRQWRGPGCRRPSTRDGGGSRSCFRKHDHDVTTPCICTGHVFPGGGNQWQPELRGAIPATPCSWPPKGDGEGSCSTRIIRGYGAFPLPQPLPQWAAGMFSTPALSRGLPRAQGRGFFQIFSIPGRNYRWKPEGNSMSLTAW